MDIITMLHRGAGAIEELREARGPCWCQPPKSCELCDDADEQMLDLARTLEMLRDGKRVVTPTD